MMLGSIGTFSIKILNIAINIYSTILLTKITNVGDYGLFTYAISIVNLITVFSTMGMEISSTKDIARHKSSNQYKSIQSSVYQYLSISGIASTVLALTFSTIIIVSQGIIEQNRSSIMTLSMALVPTITLIKIVAAIMKGFENVVISQLALSLALPGIFISALFVRSFSTQISAIEIMCYYLAAAIVTLIISLCLLYKSEIYINRKYYPKSYQIKFREYLKKSSPFFVSSILATSITNMPTVFLGFFGNYAMVALYDIAARLSALSAFLTIVVAFPLTPLIVKAHVQGDVQYLRNLTDKTTRLSFCANLLFFTICIFLGKYILSLFGAAYVKGYCTFIILGFGQLISSSVGQVALVLSMTGHEKDVIKWMIIGSILNAMLLTALIAGQVVGTESVAAVTTIVMITWNCGLAYRAFQHFKIYPLGISFLNK